MWDLVSRNDAPTPPVADALTQDGIGRAYGGQLLLRQELLHGFFGWITYSLIRSERRDHPEHDWRLFDFDQTHVLGVVASYQLGHGWDVGSALPLHHRLSAHAGLEPTSTTAPTTSTSPLFGAHNSIRIPAFYQLDARIEKAFVFRRVKLNVFLDVQNVTNRQNPEEIIYNYDFTVQSYITGFPTLAVLGARVEF